MLDIWNKLRQSRTYNIRIRYIQMEPKQKSMTSSNIIRTNQNLSSHDSKRVVLAVIQDICRANRPQVVRPVDHPSLQVSIQAASKTQPQRSSKYIIRILQRKMGSYREQALVLAITFSNAETHITTNLKVLSI